MKIAKCGLCDKNVITGTVLHSECFEKLIEENEQLKARLTQKEPKCIYEDEPICPCCSEILDESEDYNACSHCGQVIDWRNW